MYAAISRLNIWCCIERTVAVLPTPLMILPRLLSGNIGRSARPNYPNCARGQLKRGDRMAHSLRTVSYAIRWLNGLRAACSAEGKNVDLRATN